jgi:hypothetical protein
VLQPRSSFDRIDMLVAGARRSVLIVGVNLEGALLCVSTLLDLARAGGIVRLVAMDPDGTALGPAAAMSGIDPAVRRQKSIQNLELLRAEFTAHLTRPLAAVSRSWSPAWCCRSERSGWTSRHAADH